MRACRTQNVTRALNPTGGFLRGFAFTLNAYVGCAFGAAGGCPFCYVRALPVARAPAAWGDWVIAKVNLPEVLGRELARLDAAGKLRGAAIFMSSATDPYQGAERIFQLTRRVLDAFVERPPGRILVQTRSPMVERDLDLLKTLGDRVIVSITLETDDEQVRRALTPTSAGIARRLTTACRLRNAGIFTQIAIAPMLPNDPARFAAIVDDAADRVVVDTFFDGDGANGRRSRALGIAELYDRLGYREWFQPGAERELIAALRARMGEQRVLFSKDGFNDLRGFPT